MKIIFLYLKKSFRIYEDIITLQERRLCVYTRKMLASYATADPSVAKSLRGTGTTVRRQPDARVTNFELGSRSDCDPKSQDMYVLGRTLLRNKSVVVYARIIFGHIRDLPLDISPCVSCQPSCLKSRSHRSNWTELNCMVRHGSSFESTPSLEGELT